VFRLNAADHIGQFVKRSATKLHRHRIVQPGNRARAVRLPLLFREYLVKYKENHYVPVWHQQRFLPPEGERKFRYLDLVPDQIRDPRGILRKKTALHRWGAVSCFKETDLYTLRNGRYESTEIEQFHRGLQPSALSRRVSCMGGAQRDKDMPLS
jgi:hypothetical protein